MRISLQNEKGFTLIESMIAILVLVIGILSLNAMQTSSIRGNATANRITTGTSWAQEQVEDLLLTKLRDIPVLFTETENIPPNANIYTEGGAFDRAKAKAPNPTWKTVLLLDTTDDGGRTLDQDSDMNGLDDNGADAVPNFGLDNTTVPPADFSRQSPDGRFTIYYNFAINTPLPRVVTIRIIVQENNKPTAPVVFTYMKDDIL